MARFGIFENESGSGYLLDVQSDILSGLNTRVVVPLLPKSAAPSPAQRLSPVFSIEGQELVMAIQFMAAVVGGCKKLRRNCGVFGRRGLSPHYFMPMLGVHQRLHRDRLSGAARRQAGA